MLRKAEKHRHLCSMQGMWCRGSHGLCAVSYSTPKRTPSCRAQSFFLSYAVVLVCCVCSKLPAQLLFRSTGPVLCDGWGV